MEKKEIDEMTDRINKLTTEYSAKILQKQGEIKILLIDFAREYNKIWQQ